MKLKQKFLKNAAVMVMCKERCGLGQNVLGTDRPAVIRAPNSDEKKSGKNNLNGNVAQAAI